MKKFMLIIFLLLIFFIKEGAAQNRIPMAEPPSDCYCVFCPSQGCPIPEFPRLYGRYCYKDCPEGTFTIDKFPHICLDECPGNTFPVGQNCECPEGTYLSGDECDIKRIECRFSGKFHFNKK